MKKICFITTVSVTLDAFILDTAMYLHEKGDFDITFICSPDEEFAKKLPSYIKYKPISMNRGVHLSDLKSIFTMIKFFREEKFDLIQYSTPNASFYASIAAKICNVPVRLYCQWGILYVAFSGFKRILFKIIEKITCNLSTWIEPDSNGNLRFSHKEGLYTSDKSSVIGLGSASGVDLTKFDISLKSIWKHQVLKEQNIDSKMFIIGFIGRISRDKGINELLAVFKQIESEHQDVLLLIIGGEEGIDSLDQELLDWSRSNVNIIYLGHTKNVEKYLSVMNVFVLPSHREGFGSVIIEAEAMQVPVIVTNIPGPTDAMINEYTGLIVPKGDLLSLKAAIEYFIQNKHIAVKMGENGRGFVEENFSSDAVFQLILEDRQRLLEEKRKV